MSRHLKLFASCKAVKGTGRSTILDLQRKKIFFIPNSLYDLFANVSESLCYDKVRNAFDIASCAMLDEYIEFLIKNELAFFVEEESLSNFPSLNDQWFFPAHITNCILDIDDCGQSFSESLWQQLNALCCEHIQVRCFASNSFDTAINIMQVVAKSAIRSIEFVFSGITDDIAELDLLNISERFPNVALLVIGNKYNKWFVNSHGCSVIISDQDIKSNKCCGIIQLEQFAVNIPHYTESLHHNTCLNRKIAIDASGNIKNCPSMKESFGNIKDTTLEEAIRKPGFKKYWDIKKDEIVKCKDCEFRHVCTDCRAYLEDPEDIYSAPLKCGYDPYTCTWAEWSEHPLKQKAIGYYGMR